MYTHAAQVDLEHVSASMPITINEDEIYYEFQVYVILVLRII